MEVFLFRGFCFILFLSLPFCFCEDNYVFLVGSDEHALSALDAVNTWNDSPSAGSRNADKKWNSRINFHDGIDDIQNSDGRKQNEDEQIQPHSLRKSILDGQMKTLPASQTTFGVSRKLLIFSLPFFPPHFNFGPVTQDPAPTQPPVYSSPPAPPTPVYATTIPPSPSPIHATTFPPPPSSFDKPVPPTPAYHAPGPVVPIPKTPLSPPTLPPKYDNLSPPTPVPNVQNPIPPPTRPYIKKPLPPLAPPYEKPLPPVPSFSKPPPLLDPVSPIYKKPLPPYAIAPAPTYVKPNPPLMNSPKPVSPKQAPPPLIPAPEKPSPEKPAPSPASEVMPSISPMTAPKRSSPIPRAPPIPKLPPIPKIPRRYFNSPGKPGNQAPDPPFQVDGS